MPREFSRNSRVADFIQRELSVILQRELRDPRAASANVTEVAVSKDLSQAKVYVTFLESRENEQIEQAVDVLNNAAGFLRSQLAAVHTMRSTPRLRFYYDETVRSGDYLSRLIDKAVSGQGDGGQGDSGKA